MKFCKDEEKIVKIFAAEGLLLDRRSERSTASVLRSAKKRRRFENGQGEKSYKEEKRKD